MSRFAKQKIKSTVIDQSFETEDGFKPRKYTTTEVDEEIDSRSFSSQIRRTNLVLMKKKSHNTVVNRRIQLNLSTVIKDHSPIIPEFNNGSFTERKPLIQRHEEEEEELLNYSIKITPPKDHNRQKSIGRPRIQTDYIRTTEAKQRQHSPAKSITKSQTDSIYNESAIKIRNHKRERNPITSFTQPIRKSIDALRSNETLFSLVQKKLKQLRYHGSKHIDDIYPPNNSQIINMPHKRKAVGTKFERLGKIYMKSNFKLLKNCDTINLVPGKLSSKRVHSAMQILSEQPIRIMNIFQEQQVNMDGLYYLHLCQDGVFRYITIDDFLPVKHDTNKVHLLFEHIISENDEYQIWPALIQKSISKVYGTYEDVRLRENQGITPIFRLLTGYPCSEYALKADLKSYSMIIQSSIKQRYVVVLERLSETTEQEQALFKNLNLSPSLSYQVTKIQDNAIILRNYEEEVFVDAQYEFQEMSIFNKMTVFKGHQGFSYQSITLKHLFGCYSQVEIEVEKETCGFFDVWQKNGAYFKTHISGLEYAPAHYLMQLSHKDNNEDVLYIQQSGIPVTLEPGINVVKIHLCEDWELDFTVSFYGENQVKMKRIKVNQLWGQKCCQ